MASAVIGALRVNLGLDSAQFSAGIKKAGVDMTSFASRMAKMAGAIAAAAVPTLTALGVSAANSGAEIARLSQVANAAPKEFQGWAAGAKNVGIEQEKLADILKDTNDRIGDFVQTGGGPMADFFEKIAPKVGVTAESFRNLSGPQALQLYVSSLEKANVNQQDFTFYMEAMASDSTLLLPLLRNGGKGMAEYAAQAERLGAVMDNKTVAAFSQAKIAIGQVQLAMTGFRNIIAAEVVPYLSTLATAFVGAAEAGQPLGDAVRSLAAQIPRISTYVATFVGVMGARWAAAFVAARVATISLVGGLALLRGAMIRTGVGALIVAAGELAYQFVELVRRTGSFGNALAAIRTVAAEIWDRMSASMGAMLARVDAGLKELQAAARDMFAGVIETGVWFANRYIGIYRGAFDAVKAIWSLLPGAIGDVAYQAANALIKAVGWMLTQAAKPIDAFIGGLNKVRSAVGVDPIDLIGEVKLPELKNEYAGQARDAGKAAADAFSEGFSQDTFKAPSGLLEGIRAGADALRDQASGYREAAEILAKDASRPMTAWASFKEILWGADEAAVVTTENLGNLGNAAGDVADKGAAKLSKLQEVMKRLKDEYAELTGTLGMTDVDAQVWRNQRDAGVSADSKKGQEIAEQTKINEGMKSLKAATDEWRQSISSAFSSFLTGAKSFKDALSEIIGKLAEIVMNKAFESLFASTGGTGILGGILKSLGIGANAAGTNNWRGGLTAINERGAEIVDLPRGTRIIPHGLSKRIANGDGAGGYGIEMTSSQLTLTDDGKIMAQVRADVTQMGQAVSASIPGRIQQFQNNPRRR